MQRKRLHSGLFPLCRDRRESVIAKKLQNHSVFCFWNELIAETKQIRKTEGASLQRSLPHNGDAKCDVAAFLFNCHASYMTMQSANPTDTQHRGRFPSAEKAQGRAWHAHVEHGRQRFESHQNSQTPKRDEAKRRANTYVQDALRGMPTTRIPDR